MTLFTMTAARTLPVDGMGTLAGRVWRPDADGPSVETSQGCGEDHLGLVNFALVPPRSLLGFGRV